MLTSHKMALQIFESSQRDIIKNAITRHKRNQLLTKFFKRVFAEVSVSGFLIFMPILFKSIPHGHVSWDSLMYKNLCFHLFLTI